MSGEHTDVVSNSNALYYSVDHLLEKPEKIYAYTWYIATGFKYKLNELRNIANNWIP